jgi:hypothetical protein
MRCDSPPSPSLISSCVELPFVPLPSCAGVYLLLDSTGAATLNTPGILSQRALEGWAPPHGR